MAGAGERVGGEDKAQEEAPAVAHENGGGAEVVDQEAGEGAGDDEGDREKLEVP